jgi:hypothetical protein
VLLEAAILTCWDYHRSLTMSVPYKMGFNTHFKKRDRIILLFLTRSYRGHMSFLMMPSTLFYFDKLQGAKTTNGYPKQVLRASQALSTPVQLQEVELPSMLQPLKPRLIGGTSSSCRCHKLAVQCPKKKQMLLLRLPRLCTKKGVSTLSIGVMAFFSCPTCAHSTSLANV